MKEKLFRCDYCRRPIMTLTLPPKKKDGTRGKGWVWVSGPKTYPKVKRWCDGSCDGLVLHFCVLKEHVARVFRKKVKHCKWMLLSLERFECELLEYLKARDKDRVPISEKRKEIRKRLRKLGNLGDL